jgi:hypothetical protein
VLSLCESDDALLFGFIIYKIDPMKSCLNTFPLNILGPTLHFERQNGSVGIGSTYGMDGLEFQFRQAQAICSFLNPSRPALGLTQSHIQWVPGD